MLELLNYNISDGIYFPEYNGIYNTVFSFTSNLGDFSSTGDIAHDQFSSVLDGDPVVRTYNNFTVNAGHTVTPTLRCKGLYLNILGDLTVNGTLSMTARGANAEGKYIVIDKYNKKIFYLDSLESGKDYTNFTLINKTGGLGTTNKTSLTSTSDGGTGINGACAAGGGNYMYRGGHGSSFSGGSGAGGGASDSPSIGFASTAVFTHATAGSDSGGAGGAGAYDTGSGYAAQGGGGAGNPGGTVKYSSGKVGSNGTGGLMILFVRGNIIIGSSGSIQSNGSAGGCGHQTIGGTYPFSQGGGGSGGGAIHLFHKGTINTTSKITTTGGLGGVYTGSVSGGNGGNGTVNLQLI